MSLLGNAFLWPVAYPLVINRLLRMFNGIYLDVWRKQKLPYLYTHIGI